MISYSRFIDDLCAINYGNEFVQSLKNFYPKELQVKVEHQVNYPLFLDLYANRKYIISV